MPVEPGPLLARYDRLLARAANYREHCQEIAEYLVPDKSIITRLGGVEGERRMDRVFDSTGPEALGLLTATMMSALTPSTLRWFGLKTRSDELNEAWEAQRWLQECESRMRLAISQSNFYSEKFSADQDKIAFGTSAMLMEEREKPAKGIPFGGLHFRALPLGEFVIEEGSDGSIDTLFRAYEMAARNVVEQWGAAKVSETTRTLAEQRPDQRVTIIHAVYPRKIAKPRRDTLGLPFASCYLEKQALHVLQESGFHEFPYAVPRWEKLTGEVYGRGQGMRALPDLKTLNKADELTLEGWALAIRPPRVMLEDGIVGEIDLTPDGLTVESTPNALRHLENKARWDVNEGLTKERQDRIRRLFFWHQLQLQEGRVMTATEVERRWDTMRRILGPTLERQEAEDLSPIIARVFGLMQRGGALPPVPDILIGEDLDIVYEGPLSRSQKVQRVAGMEQFVGIATAVAAIDPMKAQEMMDILDGEDAARDLAEISGLPPSYLKSKDEVSAVKQARTERMAQDRQMAGFEQAANIAKGAAPLLTAMQKPQEDMAAA
jgi:hypothetical protein